MFSRILVVLGCSPSTWAAVPHVQPIASGLCSEVHLLGLCVEDQPGWEPVLKDYMEKVASSFRQESIVVRTSLAYGNPANEIPNYVDTNRITLVAGVNQSGNVITSSLLASAAKSIRQRVFTSLLMVPARHPRPNERLESVTYRRILVPLDPSESGEVVLPYVEAMARNLGSSVTLLSVNPPPPRPVPVMHSEVIRMSRTAAEAYVEQVAKRLRERGIVVDFEVVDGKPAKTILGYTKGRDVDLIAMCTRGLDIISRWIWGSVTNKVLRRAEIPVLVMSAASRPGGASPQADGHRADDDKRPLFPGDDA